MGNWAHDGQALFFDIETHNAEKIWDMAPREFFRLGQYAWGRDGEIVLTTDFDEMLEQLRTARLVIGHNIHTFDLTAMFGKDSTEPLQMAMDQRILDTFTWASQAFPSPTIWTDRNKHTYYNGNKPEIAMKWLGLDNLSHQFGLPGKMGSLREIAKKYNPAGTTVNDLDYGLIDVNDEEWLEYAAGDIVALRALALKLLALPGGVTKYIWREQQFAAVCAQNSRNGWKVDTEKAQQRVDFLTERREKIIADVVTKYGLPTEGKQPWRSNEGKAAIFAALSDFGISPEINPDWPRTKPGKTHPNGTPSLGGEVLMDLTAGTPAEDLGIALAELMGQRSLAQLALDSMKSDGMIHPDITYLQRSGRLSTTKPGLTVWTARGEGAVEKEYFVARGGNVLLEMDFSNADARVVAAYSGDKEYLKRFAPGVDAHELTGRMVWGDEVYDSDPATYRQRAKMCVHAYSYGARPMTLSIQTGLPIEVTTEFCRAMDEAYADVVQWQRDAADQGNSGWVVNDWGRRMPVDLGNGKRRGDPEYRANRSFTQSSALLGQSGTREIMVDGMLRMARANIEYITWIKAQVHDALVFEVPADREQELRDAIEKYMHTSWKPEKGGQRVEFPVSIGNAAPNWYLAGH